MTDHVFVKTGEEIDRIAPEVYGHFAEHLGRCIYGGVWVGDDDPLETDDGIRTDTAALLSDLEMPVLRWPGGCFADDYHWEDGIGPREERPTRRNESWTQGRENIPEESNTFGTDEFLRFCDLVDTEAYLAANVGTGSPDEALNWAEYCNYDGGTEYAEKRRENGREAPYDVRYWGVGNENWGCGGRFDPDDYGRRYRTFANYLRRFDRHLGTDRSLELVGCGHTTPNWNRTFLNAVEEYNLIDHLSIHRYFRAGDSTDFSEEQYYDLFASSLQVDGDIDRTADTIDALAPNSEIGVIVDEWGVWHPEADNDNGLEQANTVRDAVCAAGVLDIFNSRADILTMANIAQTVNVLQCVVQTDEEAAWVTPTYRVFDLYRPHMGAMSLRTVVDTDVRESETEDDDVPMVGASASRSEAGLYLTLTNRDLGTRTVTIGTEPGLDEAEVTASVLFEGQDPAEYSTRENAGEFAPESLNVSVEAGGELVVDAPGSTAIGISVAQ